MSCCGKKGRRGRAAGASKTSQASSRTAEAGGGWWAGVKRWWAELRRPDASPPLRPVHELPSPASSTTYWDGAHTGSRVSSNSTPRPLPNNALHPKRRRRNRHKDASSLGSSQANLSTLDHHTQTQLSSNCTCT